MIGGFHLDTQLTISSVKRIAGRAVLNLSDGVSLSMPRSMLKERSYRSGMPFDREAFDIFIEKRSYPFAMEKAVSLLAARARTEKEIVDALRRNAYPESAIARVMAYLSEAGYISDADFAEHWIAARTAKGMGTRRIRMELRHKGVPSEQIDSVISEIDDDMLLDGAVRAAQKLSRSKDLSSPADLKKVLDGLARRGYDYSLAKRAIQLLREKED